MRYDDAPDGPLRVFVDTYPAQPTIVIFGGVHIGVALAQLAKTIGGFRVVVVDARGAWATPERFSSADEIHVMHADDYLKGHPLHSNSYVAVLSHDPKLDDPALFGALQSDARFIGAIGSPKTQRERRQRLAAAGRSAWLSWPRSSRPRAASWPRLRLLSEPGRPPRCRRGVRYDLSAGSRHPCRGRLQPNGPTQTTAQVPRDVLAAARH